MEALERELLYSGAFGAGKSRIICEKGNFLSLKYPGNRGLIVRKKFTDLRDTTMYTWWKYVFLQDHKANYNKNEHLLTYTNGSEVLFHGLDQPTKVASLEVGWIAIDEIIEFTLDDYIMLLGRLRHALVPFRQIFAATNPSNPQHWVYKRFYLDTQLKREGVTKVLESDATQNPFNPQDYRDSLNRFKGRYKDRFVLGRWVSFEGLVYDCWDPSRHVIPRDTTKYGLTGDSTNPIPAEWEKFRAIDFGFTNPFVCQWWASPRYRYEGEPGKQDRVVIPWAERKFFMYREIYHAGVTTDVHGDNIRNLTGNEKILATFCDWDAGDRAILEKTGIPTKNAKKEVSIGIQTLYEWISNDQIFFLEDSLVTEDWELEAEGKPTCTEQEFMGYNRPKGKDGKHNPKEDPAKYNDHGLDAARYLIYTLSKLHTPSGQFQAGKTQDAATKAARNGSKRPTMSSGSSAVRTYGSRHRGSWRRL